MDSKLQDQMDNLTAPATLGFFEELFGTTENPQKAYPLEGTDEAQGIPESQMALELEVRLNTRI